MKVFELDGPVYKIGSDLADVMILSFIWILFCIPVVTIGASTTTVFYIYGKKARGEDTYIIKDFVKSFKQNFLQSIPMTILFLIVWASVFAYYLLIGAYGSEAPLGLTVLTYFFTLEAIIMTMYSFGILARFHMKTSKILSSAFILGHKHVKQTGMVLLSIIATVIGIGFLPVLIIFAPVVIIALSSIPLQKVFTEHIELVKTLEEQTLINEALVEENRELEQEIFEETKEKEVQSKDKEVLLKEDTEDKDYLKYI